MMIGPLIFVSEPNAGAGKYTDDHSAKNRQKIPSHNA